MRPYEAYMSVVKAASSQQPPEAELAQLADRASKVADPRNTVAYKNSQRIHEKDSPLKSIAQNVTYGVLTSGKSAGPFSIVGSSMGGVIDGLLYKPVVDAGIGLVGRGIQALSGSERAKQ